MARKGSDDLETVAKIFVTSFSGQKTAKNVEWPSGPQLSIDWVVKFLMPLNAAFQHCLRAESLIPATTNSFLYVYVGHRRPGPLV